jgi:uncharacterized membrane protein YbhN (UPF0104 family)
MEDRKTNEARSAPAVCVHRPRGAFIGVQPCARLDAFRFLSPTAGSPAQSPSAFQFIIHITGSFSSTDPERRSSSSASVGFQHDQQRCVPYRRRASIQIPAQRYNIPRAQLTASVLVVETVLDGFTFLVLVLLVLGFLGLPSISAGLLWGFCAAGALGFITVLMIARLQPPRDLAQRRWMRIFSQDVRVWIGEKVPQFLDGLEAMRDPRRLWKVIAISFPAWLAEGVMFWFFGMAYSLGLAPHKFIIIMIAANLITALPITPWNIGPYEVVVQEVAAALGVDRDLAAGYAIGMHILMIMWITFSGVVAVWLLKLSLRDVVSLGRRRGAVTGSFDTS